MEKLHQYISGYMSKWLSIATLAGMGGGLAAVMLKKSIIFVKHFGGGFPLWIAPAIGGIIISLIYLYDPHAAGLGTDHYIDAVNLEEQYHLTFKNFYTKIASTAVTLGFKGSGGVEGPMLMIGASLTDAIASVPILRRYISGREFDIVTICGAAGAIGAIFRSPIGGGIFVAEVLYHSSLHYSDLFPAILSSIMGFVVYRMLVHPTPMFDIPDYLPDVSNIPVFLLSAIVAVILSIIFTKVYTVVYRMFCKLPGKKIHPIIGGLLTGLIIMQLPQVSGTGIDVIQTMIDKNLPITLLLLLLVGKMFATSFTVASGGSAGLVIPALFIGAIAGNSFSTILKVTDPALSSSLVVSGMAASLASVANVPIAAAVMLMEMAGYKLGVPAALGSIIGYAVGHSHVIYGISCPDDWQYNDFKEIKKRDRKHGGH
ncbi:chloride channel protein [Alkaliphilus hydrothermalis]|uniref:CIC family chloride channel protein n=1 Tax=Alkaliphilus hydrothermalis TaxID=1482730 RepID=A0ABS2NSK8_9FIRM|nr:chloride channel protein [Alkaliphilus hydrothermalis]MBM7615938.1 CIC family chloride channel protein [Alkaliphilus hydrothermalis]